MNYESFLELVQERRSIRRFKPDPVPDEYVDKIIEAARWAPSGANSQPWEFIVIRKRELKDSIVKLVEEQSVKTYTIEQTREPELRHTKYIKPPPYQAGFADAPVFIITCGDPRTQEAYPLISVSVMGESTFVSSLASAFLYMHLAATALGLGSQWVSSTVNPYNQLLIKKLLGIPKELKIYDMMAVGYSASIPKPRLVRAKKEMVHYDYYDEAKFRIDEEVNKFIRALRVDRQR